MGTKLKDEFGEASYRHVYLGYLLTLVQGQVDQLEDRYLGMVEASGSNPDLSIFRRFMASNVLVFPESRYLLLVIKKRSA